MSQTFNTTFVSDLKLKLSELNHTAEIHTKYHLTDQLLHYTLILDRDILHELGIVLILKIKLSLGKKFQSQ